jgi:hypothetical protein
VAIAYRGTRWKQEDFFRPSMVRAQPAEAAACGRGAEVGEQRFCSELAVSSTTTSPRMGKSVRSARSCVVSTLRRQFVQPLVESDGQGAESDGQQSTSTVARFSSSLHFLSIISRARVCSRTFISVERQSFCVFRRE